jgi:hypothetical protein
MFALLSTATLYGQNKGSAPTMVRATFVETLFITVCQGPSEMKLVGLTLTFQSLLVACTNRSKT